jgi:hypothetical protein
VSARKQAVIDRFTTSRLCPDCRGERLNELARSVWVAGHTITECTAMEVADLVPVIAGVDHPASAPVVQSLVERLEALAGIGLGYLSLGRATTTLSGGESQRIKMVRHLGSSLIEMLYVFDEPSIGLHPTTCSGSPGCCASCATRATPSWWSSTTRTSSPSPTTSSTSARVPAPRVGRSSFRAPSCSSPPPAASPAGR